MSESNWFRHFEKPTIEPISGEVKGSIPAWLNGTLIRNGPGIQKIGEERYKHFFDGLAILHRFHIENGVVTYNSRALESDTYHKNMAAQRIVVGEFGTYGVGDPCDTLFNKFKSLFIPGKPKTVEEKDKMTDNCSVNVAFFGDELFAMTETSFIRRIDPKTLDTIGKKTWLPEYVAINQATAHPHVLEDGTILNIGNNWRHKKGTRYCIIKIPPTFNSNDSSGFKHAKIVAEIPARWKMYPGYTHSFGLTTDKIIYIEQPFCFKLPKVMFQPLTHVSFNDCLEWYPNEKTRIHVASLTTGEIHPIVYETDNLFTFHHANAYEENGQIVMDVAGYDDAKFVQTTMGPDTMKKSERYSGASLRRYVLPLSIPEDLVDEKQNLVTLKETKARATVRSKKTTTVVDVTPELLVDEWVEFPRINYKKYNGKKYKYVYCVTSSKQRALDSAIPEPDNITKIDTTDNGKMISWHGEGILASEPVFVENSTKEHPEEDDGVVLAALLHEGDQYKTSLLVLNAKDMTELGRVDFKANGPVTSTFHGQWAGVHEKVHTY